MATFYLDDLFSRPRALLQAAEVLLSVNARDPQAAKLADEAERLADEALAVVCAGVRARNVTYDGFWNFTVRAMQQSALAIANNAQRVRFVVSALGVEESGDAQRAEVLTCPFCGVVLAGAAPGVHPTPVCEAHRRATLGL